jgi:hypothetical protein
MKGSEFEEYCLENTAALLAMKFPNSSVCIMRYYSIPFSPLLLVTPLSAKYIQ